jgi:hypothetical protein
MNTFIRLIFIAAFLLLYMVAIIILKPLRQHVKRKYSTIALKFSYLIYLSIFLIFTYLFMFYNGGAASIYLEDPDDPRAMVHFSILLLAFIIPNTGILIRRKIKWRKEFNIIMSFINIIFAVYLLKLIEATITK